MYLLQSAAESLQAIQVRKLYWYYNYHELSLQYTNTETFCTDIVGKEEIVYDALVATNHDSIEPILFCLKYRKDWKYTNYPEAFNTSGCVGYNDEKCQLYTSLYMQVYNTTRSAGKHVTKK